MIKKPVIFLAITLCAICHIASADHPTIAFGSEAAGPVSTIPAIPMPAETWGFGLRTEIINNDAFSTEQLEDFAANGLEGVHSIDKIRSTSVSLSYGMTDDFSVNARLPYIERKNIRESEIEDGVPEAHTHGNSSGVGDLLILTQYQVYTTERIDLAIQFGVKAPTGETEVKDKNGARFETEFQPGSGSWDYLLGASVSKSSNGLGYHANILYNKTTQGSQSTEIGDVLTYNAALSYRLGVDASHDHAGHDHNESEITGVVWDLLMEFNGETRAKNEIAGIEDVNSGGSILFLSPGFRASSGMLSGFISVGIPVIEDQNGKQTDIDTRIVAGLSFAI